MHVVSDMLQMSGNHEFISDDALIEADSHTPIASHPYVAAVLAAAATSSSNDRTPTITLYCIVLTYLVCTD
jgi:hypothetical protein